jgi:hypothetical protein
MEDSMHGEDFNIDWLDHPYSHVLVGLVQSTYNMRMMFEEVYNEHVQEGSTMPLGKDSFTPTGKVK